MRRHTLSPRSHRQPSSTLRSLAPHPSHPKGHLPLKRSAGGASSPSRCEPRGPHLQTLHSEPPCPALGPQIAWIRDKRTCPSQGPQVQGPAASLTFPECRGFQQTMLSFLLHASFSRCPSSLLSSSVASSCHFLLGRNSYWLRPGPPNFSPHTCSLGEPRFLERHPCPAGSFLE